jgi:2-iminobutanoate/2-iminopropanoate deaminase
MAKEIINTESAPKPAGAYSQGVKAGGFIFVAGQLPIDPVTGIMHYEGVHKDTRRIMGNISAVLEAAGSSIEKIVKLMVFLKDIEDIKFVNEVLEELFGSDLPARSAVEVARLPKDAKVEIEAIALE